jgi:Polyketide cyclase / dehydrase and lipid transport
MIELSFSVSIARPPAVVFSILADFETYLARWAKGPIAASKLTPGPTGPGTRFARRYPAMERVTQMCR